MSSVHRERRLNLFVLCVALVAVTVVFGVPVEYGPATYWSLAVIQAFIICAAAWRLGAWAITSESEERRSLAVAGAMLIAPWVLFSFLAGFGRPDQATNPENQIRYVILLLNAITVAGGLIVLKDALSKGGERFYSTLGFAAILLAAPLQLFWSTLLIEIHHAMEHAGTVGMPPDVAPLADLSDVPLFFAGILTYLATAAFATSLGRVGWLGRELSLTLTIASLLLTVCLSIRGLQFPDPAKVFMHWYAIPGWVAGIPAIPWFMPCAIGVALLRRAGSP